MLSLNEEKQQEVLREVLKKKLTVADTERLIKKEPKPKKKKASADVKKTISRNVKIALNTLQQAIGMIEKTGTSLQQETEDLEDEYVITIRIHKQRVKMKLLATDMDGTFLRDDKSYSEEFNDLYNQMLKQGIQFVIASGNQYEALVCKFDDDIKDDLYYLCENGTKIVYRGDVIYKHCLETDDYQHALNILKEDEECMLVVSGVKHAYILKKFEDRKDFITLFIKNIVFVDSFDEIDDEILKFSVANFDGKIEDRLEVIKKRINPKFRVVTTGNVWFDIFIRQLIKELPYNIFQNLLGISNEEAGAFGDQMNDYEMLQTVKYGYAMANAMPPVKEVAYQVIDSNENDGVILKIKEILKGKC